MAELLPCPACRRHIAISEAACPFCSAAVELVSTPARVPRGVSRAAVFASTLLVAPACASDPPVTQHVQQPPPPDHHAQPPPPDPPPPPGPTNVDPPPAPKPAPTATAGVHIFVAWDNQRPYVGTVELQGPASHSGQTNEKGQLIIKNLPPGAYLVSVPSNNPRESPRTARVELRAGTVERVSVTMVRPVYDRVSPNKPYGAPPARRRIV